MRVLVCCLAINVFVFFFSFWIIFLFLNFLQVLLAFRASISPSFMSKYSHQIYGSLILRFVKRVVICNWAHLDLIYDINIWFFIDWLKLTSFIEMSLKDKHLLGILRREDYLLFLLLLRFYHLLICISFYFFATFATHVSWWYWWTSLNSWKLSWI